MKAIMIIAIGLCPAISNLWSQGTELIFRLEMQLMVASSMTAEGLSPFHDLTVKISLPRSTALNALSPEDAELLTFSQDIAKDLRTASVSTFATTPRRAMKTPSMTPIFQEFSGQISNVNIATTKFLMSQPNIPSWLKVAPTPPLVRNRMFNPQFELVGIQLKF